MRRTFLLIVAAILVICPLALRATEPMRFSYVGTGDANYALGRFAINDIAVNNIFLNWKAGHEAETLLLSCMDFRLIGAVAKYMEKNDKQGEYDYVVLAGAS